MKISNHQAPFNFGGVDPIKYEDARVIVLPVPYDGTTTYKSGTRNGPDAIIDASRNMEWFDEELGSEPASIGIFTLEELKVKTLPPEKMVKIVEENVLQILNDKKFPLMLGGEHSVSAGAFAAFRKKFKDDFSILQFDAHPDLRDEYEGSKYNHACVLRRGFDLGIPITQIGIRSICLDDHLFLQKNDKMVRTFYAKDMEKWDLGKIISSLGKNVYISFDIDALDSSIMPATGTPEPGGLFWNQALKILKEVATKRSIIGADLVELLPTKGLHACDFLAAKLAYKMIGYSFMNRMKNI